MEVFAGFSENTDWNVGRLLDAVEEMGELDNTLVIYIWGDNGASMEGTITGSFNETTFFNGLVLDAEQQLALIEKFGGLEGLGGFHSAPHFAAAWAHAQNTPFQWGKQMASHLGGARDPMVIAWPGHIKAGGDRPDAVHPLHRHRADDPRPGRHPGAQGGGRDRAGADGRHAVHATRSRTRRPRAAHRPVLRDVRQPRHLQGRLVGLRPAGQAAVGLLAGDPRPVQAGQRVRPGPGQVGALLPAGRLLAGPRPRGRATRRSSPSSGSSSGRRPARNRALPLLGGMAVFFGDPAARCPRTRGHTFAGDVQNVSTTVIPRIYGRSYSIEADIHVPEGGAEGVLCAFADFIGGFALWVDERGHLDPHVPVPGRGDLQAGLDRADPDRRRRWSRCCSRSTSPSRAPAATSRLWANGKQIGEGRLDHTCSMLFTTYAGMDMGRDNGGVVDDAYEDKAPYAFTGTLRNVVFDLKPMALEAEQALHEAASTAGVASGAGG